MGSPLAHPVQSLHVCRSAVAVESVSPPHGSQSSSVIELPPQIVPIGYWGRLLPPRPLFKLKGRSTCQYCRGRSISSFLVSECGFRVEFKRVSNTCRIVT